MARYDDLAGRTVLIAGGATMIGAELACAFAAQGSNVVIADIDFIGGRAAAKACGKQGMFIHTDVTDDLSLDACIAGAKEAFGGIDFLINVTTSYIDEGIATTRQDWLRAIDIGLVGGAILAQKLRGELVRRRGAIVNFSSVSAHRAQAGRFVYPAIKSAIAQLTRSQALEFAPFGVRVNSITPGWTWSNVLKAMSSNNRARTDEVGGAFHMQKRVADADELAGAVLFLCSEDASFVTGTDLVVDGGYLALGPEQAGNPIAALADV